MAYITGDGARAGRGSCFWRLLLAPAASEPHPVLPWRCLMLVVLAGRVSSRRSGFKGFLAWLQAVFAAVHLL